MKKGIVVAGNLIVDYVKSIENYPQEGMLANIRIVMRGIGGCAANTSAGLSMIDPGLKVLATGLVGKDENGSFITDYLASCGVDVSHIGRIDQPTSFTDVMSVPAGQRTFFHARGANAYFEDLPPELFDFSHLHMGYALLLDRMDREDDEHGTRMARLLAIARSHGVKTSLDVVSESSDRFKRVILPSLRHCDNLIINETEASLITGARVRETGGAIDHKGIEEALRRLLEAGVHESAVIHAPEGGWVLNKAGDFAFEPSLQLPPGYIKGTVGAGDAFCAGYLYSLIKEEPLDRSLQFAAAAAASNLSQADSVSGMKPSREIWDLFDLYRH
jgi:sugar/nucleoside kinase (ribokinase family)